MASNEQEQEYSFSLKRIVLLEKTLTLKPGAKSGDFAFDVSLQVKGSPEEQECLNVMTVKVCRQDNKEVLGSLTLGCTFAIPKFQEYAQSSEDKASLPDDLLNLLSTVVIGAIRGVMFSEFRGTVLNNAYLPILDPRRFDRNG